MKRILIFIFVLLGLVSGVNATVNDAITYFSFDTSNVSGSTMLDLSGNNKDGTCVNMVDCDLVTGILNNATDLDGIAEYINPLDFSGTTLGTVNIWVNIDVLADFKSITSYGDVATDTNYYSIDIMANGKIRFGGKISGTTNIQETTTTPLSTGSWQMVTVANNGLVNKIYHNGILQSATIIAGSGGVWFSDLNSVADSGSIGSLTRQSMTGYLNGKVDEFAIYDRELSISEIETLYNNGSAFNPYTSTAIPSLTYTNITANNIPITNNTFYNDTITFETFVLNTSTNSNVNHTYSINGGNQVPYATNSLTGILTLKEFETDPQVLISGVEYPLESNLFSQQRYCIEKGGVFSTTGSNSTAGSFTVAGWFNDEWSTFTGAKTNKINCTTAPKTYEDGIYDILFYAYNNETNVTSSTYDYIIDSTAPVITVIGNVSVDSYFVNFSEIFAVNYSISGEDFCTLNITYLSANESDSNFFINCTDTQVFSRAGDYNGFLTAKDNAGNIQTGSVNGTINPLINIFFNDTSNGTIILEYNATIFHPDGRITFPTVQPDGSIQLSPVNDGELDLGNHTIQFQKDSYSKTNFTQLVNTTNAGTNTTFNVTLASIDISIFNRLDESLITELVNIQLIGPIGITSSTSTGTLNINSTVLVAGDYELITTSTNYFTESLFFTYNNQETIDLDIFMLNKTQANQGQINIFVKNEFEELQPNILVKLLSYNNNSNSFTDVSQTLTDLNGAAIFNIELGTKKYIFRAISGDIIADSSEKGEFVFITGDSRTLILRQGQLQKIPLFKNFIYDVVENETARNNNISNIIVTWDDSDNLVNKVCIQYFKKTGITTIFLQEFCEESSSGILESNVLLNLSQNSIVADVVAFIDDSTNELDSFTYLSSNNVEDVLNSLGFLDYIILALVVIAIGIGIWMDIPAVGAGAVIGISWWMVATFPSFVNGTLAALVTLICLGIISAAVRRE